MVSHVPVLLDEVLHCLAIQPDGRYVDATFGRGGHSRAILERLGAEGRLLALDRDPDAVAAGKALEADDPRFRIVRARFGGIGEQVSAHGLAGRVNGILFDVGVSSPQLEDPRRGFGFRADGPLDMRMDPASGVSAATWLARAGESEIADVLRRHGEEPAARRIARAICRVREQTPITTTRQLADLVAEVVRGEPGRHPATRTFQAIRIHVNEELEELASGLAAALPALAVGGRLVVISFHSLEDRLVKRFLRDHSRVDPALAKLPVVPPGAEPVLRIIASNVRPGADEIARNPRARSAVLRAAEKIR